MAHAAGGGGAAVQGAPVEGKMFFDYEQFTSESPAPVDGQCVEGEILEHAIVKGEESSLPESDTQYSYTGFYRYVMAD